MPAWDVLKHASSVPHLTSKNKMSRWWQAVRKWIDNVLLSVGHLHRWCQWTANLQSSSVICALTYVMLALVNVNITMLITASNARKLVATVLKNVEWWLSNRGYWKPAERSNFLKRKGKEWRCKKMRKRQFINHFDYLETVRPHQRTIRTEIFRYLFQLT